MNENGMFEDGLLPVGNKVEPEFVKVVTFSVDITEALMKTAQDSEAVVENIRAALCKAVDAFIAEALRRTYA